MMSILYYYMINLDIINITYFIYFLFLLFLLFLQFRLHPITYTSCINQPLTTVAIKLSWPRFLYHVALGHTTGTGKNLLVCSPRMISLNQSCN